MNLNKKSISVVVVSILLVIVSTVSTMAFFNWSQSYSTDLLGEASNKKKLVGETRIIRVLKDNLYLYSGYENIKINKVSIEGEECNIILDSSNPNNEFTSGSININFEDSCTNSLTDKTNEILIETDKGAIYKKTEIIGIDTSNSENSNNGGSNNDCSSGSIPYNRISFSHSSLNNLETKTLEEDESISNGFIKHNIDVICQNSIVSSDSSTYKKETICDGGFEVNGDSCEEKEGYEVSEDELILIDYNLGLDWQRTNYPNYMNWTDAVSYCDNLTHSIYDDWRLPELNELESLIDKSVSSSPYIVGQYEYFPEIEKSWYWTNTLYSSSTAYYVYFYRGYSDYVGTSSSPYVLCLRNS